MSASNGLRLGKAATLAALLSLATAVAALAGDDGAAPPDAALYPCRTEEGQALVPPQRPADFNGTIFVRTKPNTVRCFRAPCPSDALLEVTRDGAAPLKLQALTLIDDLSEPARPASYCLRTRPAGRYRLEGQIWLDKDDRGRDRAFVRSPLANRP